MSTPSVNRVPGTGYRQVNIPRLSPEQQALFSQVFSATQPSLGPAIGRMGEMAAGGTPEMWAQLEAPAMNQFAGLMGNMASRFSGMGAGARRSSGFNNATSGAASSLAQDLASQRLGLQQNALSQLLGLYQSLMGTQTQDTMFMPKKKPWWAELLGGLGGAAGQAAGTFGGLGLGKWSGLMGSGGMG